MMAERDIAVDHTTIHRWTVRYAPLLLERFNRRKRSMTGRWHAAIILSGIEMIHMMRKRQARFAFNSNPSLAEQFAILAA
jgi:transposase-like protein